MTDTFEKLSDITRRVVHGLQPVIFEVPIAGPLAGAIREYAAIAGVNPETIIAESVRAYMGDAA